MSRIKFIFVFSCLLSCSLGADVEKILRQMTLKQKLGQMIMGDVTNFQSSSDLSVPKSSNISRDYSIGFLFDTNGYTCDQIGRFTRSSLNELATTLPNGQRIPVAFALDAVRGTSFVYDATVFVHNIGLAASWNLALARQQAATTGRELRICGYNIGLSPAVDNGNMPLWGRHYETWGTETMAASAFGRQLAKFIPEGSRSVTTTDTSYGIASTLKHWIGYGLPDTGRDRTNATVSVEDFDRTVFPAPRNVLLSADPLIVMVNSGAMNGIPLHADHIRVQRLLRGRLGFQGLIISDYDDFVRVFSRHKYASSLEDAFQLVLDAGLDVHLTESRVDSTLQTLEKMIRSGKIKESRIDESVRRVLTLKNALGMLEPNYAPGFPSLKNTIKSPADVDVAKKIVEQSVTLLMNRDLTLPVRDLSRGSKVVVIGPTGNSLAAQCGGWLYSFRGLSSANPTLVHQNTSTIMQDVYRIASQRDWTFVFESGILGFDRPDPNSLQRARNAASGADIVILCVGEPPHSEGTYPITDLALPIAQIDLINAITSLRNSIRRPRIVLVQIAGRPRLLHPFENRVDAIIHAFLPCIYGGDVVSRIIFGQLNPSGRLPFPFPAENGPKRLVLDPTTQTWRPFGFGLSYSRFEYSNLTAVQIQRGGPLQVGDPFLNVTVDLSNTGPMIGSEVVFLQIQPVADPFNPSYSELKRFRRLDDLKVGTKIRVRFSLFPEDFRYFKPSKINRSSFVIKIGPLSSQIDLNFDDIVDLLDDITIIDTIDHVEGEILEIQEPTSPPKSAPEGSVPIDYQPVVSPSPHQEPISPGNNPEAAPTPHTAPNDDRIVPPSPSMTPSSSSQILIRFLRLTTLICMGSALLML